MNNTALKLLCEKVGRELTGKPCQVRFRQPAWTGAKGTACKRNGKAVVDVRPGLGPKDFLYVLLHELAHVVDLWDEWTGDVPDFQPGSLRLPALHSTSKEVAKDEGAAEELAQKWLDFAERHAEKYSGSWLVSRLRALEHYNEIVIQEAVKKSLEKHLRERREKVDQAVKAGVEVAMKKVRQNLEGAR